MSNRRFLVNLMTCYTVDNLVNVSLAEFERRITALPGTTAHNVKEPETQRTQNVKFVWGHNHDFGTFGMDGAMADRHVDVLAWAMDELYFSRDLTGKRVFDVGCWTGGTSLLLAAMGAKVNAIDEVIQYTHTLAYLAQSFRVAIESYSRSIYQLRYSQGFDIVCMFGVLYHLTDPVLALRILFNSLEDGGHIFIETSVSQYVGRLCEYRGPNSHTPWTWFVPTLDAVKQMCEDVGFRVAGTATRGMRALVWCVRDEYKPMMRAGVSQRNV